MKKKGKKKKIYAYNKAIMKDNREIRKKRLSQNETAFFVFAKKSGKS